MNRVVINGNLTKENEVRYTTNMKAVLNNTLAVKKKIKNPDGTYPVDFIEVVFWNHNAEFLKKYTNKGDKILVEGSLNTRKYENSEGKLVYITEVIADNVEILYKRDKKENETAEMTESTVTTEPVATFGFDASQSNVFAEFGEQMEITDADLPF